MYKEAVTKKFLYIEYLNRFVLLMNRGSDFFFRSGLPHYRATIFLFYLSFFPS
nr:hypothetical protein BN993_05227 [Virgibacillus halodenitrificans]